MRILTLFLALFLSLLPETVPFENYSQTQEVCCEDIDDVEEEAVIKTVQREQRQSKDSSISISQGICRSRVDISVNHPIEFSFERHWLTYCRLRL